MESLVGVAVRCAAGIGVPGLDVASEGTGVVVDGWEPSGRSVEGIGSFLPVNVGELNAIELLNDNENVADEESVDSSDFVIDVELELDIECAE